MSDAFAGGRLTIDLGALQANWRTLNAISPDSECAAVVKADAYGIGLPQAARALAEAGARTFFVAHLAEATIVRRVVPESTIYVLNGLPPGAAAAYLEAGVRPVLGSIEEIEEWAATAAASGEAAAAIHVDTGMNRLGLAPAEARELFGRGLPFRPALLMSHLACADEPDRPETERQRALFAELCTLVPETPVSLSNSAGTLLPRSTVGDLAFDLRRPGIALYGSNPLDRPSPVPLRPVVSLEARIIQVREAPEGAAIGYGGAERLKRASRISVLSLGYADGIFRAGGSEDGALGATAWLDGTPCPLLGRVSMDLIAIDVTDAPNGMAKRGAWVEILGAHVGVDDLARACGTIGYEVLTNLGRRYERRYVSDL